MRFNDAIDGHEHHHPPLPGDPDAERVPTLIETMGGPWGLVESSLPAVVFVVAWTVSGQDTKLAGVIAVALTGVLAAIRLARRESPVQALGGLVGVGISAWIATKTGKAENFFLPGLLINVAYAAAMLISVVVGWPAIGLIVGQLDGTGTSWRDEPHRLGLMRRATLFWAGLFLSRLAVQIPLYLAGAVVALGVVKTAMGFPLYLLGLWLTYRMLRPPKPAPA